MRALLVCNDQANQRALAHRLAGAIALDGIVVVESPGRRSGSSSLVRRGARFLAGLPLRCAWFAMLRHYERSFPRFPSEPLLHVADVNESSLADLVAGQQPELVIVSGTNLLKQPLITKIEESGKTINLHTGISPYVRGAPNCTNWCLALRRFDLIGNSVMWIDAGIDSGNLIATERTPLSGRETLSQLHIAVMDHAHELYVRCARLILDGTQVANVPQAEVGVGELYRLRDWTPRRALGAAWNHARRNWEDRREIRLVSPTEGVMAS